MLKFIISIFIFSSVFALSVKMGDESDPIAYGRNDAGVPFEVLMTSSGDGASKLAAFTLYMPFQSDSAAQSGMYYSNVGTLPGISSVLGGVQFSLDIDTDDNSAQKLLLAVRNSSDDSYNIVSKATASNTFFVPMSSLCISGTDMKCDILDDAGLSSDDDITEAYLYIFLSDTLDVGEIGIKPSDHTGVHVRGIFSTHIKNYVAGNTKITSIELARGDTVAYLDFAGIIETTTYMRGVAVYEGVDGPAGFYDIFETGTKETGEVTITDLSNSATGGYNFTAAFVDKFGYRSFFSPALQNVKPTLVPALLQEKACYLVTAGFQRDHYVLDYFRHIRDQYLLTNSLGIAFVEYYYATAPKYAQYILKSESLAKIVRSVSYVLYFALKYLSFTFFVLILIYAATINRKVRRNHRGRA